MISTKLVSCFAFFVAFEGIKCFASINVSEIERMEIWMRSQNKEDVIKCASAGDMHCQIAMGMYYRTNKRFFFDKRENKKRNNSEAIKWLENNTGKSAVARFFMANKLYDEKLSKEGLALLESAAVEGNYESLLELTKGGIGLYNSTEQEEKETMRWGKLLYQHYPSGQAAYNVAMGYFYDSGKNTCPQGENWLKKAAFLHNDLNAQEYMGSLYEQGHCLPQDNIMAYMMYDLGGTAASNKKQALAQKMTPEEIDEATRRSHDWQDEHHSYRPGYGSGVSVHWNMH